jgi:hypothetical protein
MIAAELGHIHVGGFIQIEVEDDEALFTTWTAPRELAWVAFDGHGVTVGLWPANPDDKDETFEEFMLETDRVVEVRDDDGELCGPYRIQEVSA